MLLMLRVTVLVVAISSALGDIAGETFQHPFFIFKFCLFELDFFFPITFNQTLFLRDCSLFQNDFRFIYFLHEFMLIFKL